MSGNKWKVKVLDISIWWKGRHCRNNTRQQKVRGLLECNLLGYLMQNPKGLPGWWNVEDVDLEVRNQSVMAA